MKQRILAGIITTTFYGIGSCVHAAGFALVENSGSGMGNAFAGTAAVAEDASTVWSNPAGMALLENKTQASFAAHVIVPKASFEDQGSYINPSLTSNAAVPGSLTGSNDDGGKLAVVPNAYLVRPLSDKVKVGVGINAPFGLATSYDDTWVGRYHALDSEMKTININPAISYQVNEKLAVGAGINAQYIDVKLSSAIDSSAACLSMASQSGSGTLLNQCISNGLSTPSNQTTDSKVTIKGDDVSYGFNLGAIYQPTDKTRVGLSYRSKVKHSLKGNADYEMNAALQSIATAAGVTRFDGSPAVADVELPASASLSASHKLNDKVEVLGDITYTDWSSFEKLRATNPDTGGQITNVDESWRNVTRVSAGVNYQYNDKLKLRTGVAHDKSPVPDVLHRTARTPDVDRFWVAAGANYKLRKNLSMDVGYAHLFMDNAAIDNTDEATGYALRGVYDSNVDIVSAQLNWSF